MSIQVEQRSAPVGGETTSSAAWRIAATEVESMTRHRAMSIRRPTPGPTRGIPVLFPLRGLTAVKVHAIFALPQTNRQRPYSQPDDRYGCTVRRGQSLGTIGGV